MATQELNVKFKVDASEVKKGSTEAKKTVKDAATSMEADVKSSTRGMESSMKGVSKATKDVADATKDASSSVRQMEGEVASSSKSMEQNLGRVAKQMNAMQMFHMGARGIGMLGGAAQSVLRLYGDEESAEDVATATSIGQSGFQGAAMGFAAGGPWGAAIGGLVGAGSALLEAAVKQKEAAEATLQANRGTIETIETQNNDRIFTNWVQETATAKNFDEGFAQDQIDAAKERVASAQTRLNEALDVAKGRVETQYYGKSIAVDGKILERNTNFGNIDWADKNATAGLEETLGTSLFKFIHDMVSDSVKDANQELADAQKELAMLAPLQARIEQVRAEKTRKEQQRIADQWKAFDEYQNGKDAAPTNNKEEIKAARSTLEDAVRRRDDFKTLYIKGSTADEAQNGSDDNGSATNDSTNRKRDRFVLDPAEYESTFAALQDAVRTAADNLKTISPTDYTKFLESEQRSSERTMADYERQLQGVVSRPAETPVDQLTRIGGGGGYASYNNSTAQIQKNIESYLKTLISNQKSQIQEISDKLTDIANKETTFSWG